LWTEEFKQEVSHEEESEGVFFQTVEQVKSDWGGLWESSDVQGWSHSYWLNLGRDVVTQKARANWCSSENCRANEWNIVSPINQRVHIGLLRHHRRSYDHCQNVPSDNEAYAFARTSFDTTFRWVQEGVWFNTYTMQAGESVLL